MSTDPTIPSLAETGFAPVAASCRPFAFRARRQPR